MPKYDFKVAKKLYLNHTSSWMFSSKFAAYFQNTFSWEHLLGGCFFILFFMWRANLLFDNRELLNFDKPFLSLCPSLIISKSNKIDDWSLQNEAKTSVLQIDPWKTFETKKSNLRWIKPELWFCQKVNLLFLEFLSLQISQSSKVFLNSTFWLHMFLTHFSPVSHFYAPWKRQKTKGFLTFSGSIEMWHWTKMG